MEVLKAGLLETFLEAGAVIDGDHAMVLIELQPRPDQIDPARRCPRVPLPRTPGDPENAETALSRSPKFPFRFPAAFGRET